MASKGNRFLRWLTGGATGGAKDSEPGEAVGYNGYTIRPAARTHGGEWLTSGLISKEIDGEPKEHHFTRAETHPSKEAADAFSIDKAKRIIDELGDRVFRDG